MATATQEFLSEADNHDPAYLEAMGSQDEQLPEGAEDLGQAALNGVQIEVHQPDAGQAQAVEVDRRDQT